MGSPGRRCGGAGRRVAGLRGWQRNDLAGQPLSTDCNRIIEFLEHKVVFSLKTAELGWPPLDKSTIRDVRGGHVRSIRTQKMGGRGRRAGQYRKGRRRSAASAEFCAI